MDVISSFVSSYVAACLHLAFIVPVYIVFWGLVYGAGWLIVRVFAACIAIVFPKPPTTEEQIRAIQKITHEAEQQLRQTGEAYRREAYYRAGRRY
jgi:hypothetical protein